MLMAMPGVASPQKKTESKKQKTSLVKRLNLICSHVIAGGWWYAVWSYTSSNNSLVVVVAKYSFARRDFQWLYHSFTVSLSTDCSLFKFGLLFSRSWLMLTGILAACLISSSGRGCWSRPPCCLKTRSLGAEHTTWEQLCTGWPPSHSTQSISFPMLSPDLGNSRELNGWEGVVGETELGMKGGKEAFISRRQVSMCEAFINILYMTPKL